MELDRDPTDLGVRYAVVDEDDQASLEELRAIAPTPERREASPEFRRAIVHAFAAQRGRSSQRDRLEHPCGCGAPKWSWCRRRGVSVVGLVHESRPAPGP